MNLYVNINVFMYVFVFWKLVGENRSFECCLREGVSCCLMSMLYCFVVVRVAVDFIVVCW